MLVQTSSQLLHKLDPQQLPLSSKVVALLGPSQHTQLHRLILQLLFTHASRGERVGVIVGDNHFDAYHLARLARAHDFNPVELLAQIDLSRPFTCHQLHHSILMVEALKHKWGALYVPGFLSLFYDEDVKYAEVTRLLKASLKCLKQMAVQGLPVLVTLSPPPAESTRREFVEIVVNAADMYWKPSEVVLARLVPQQMEFTI